MKTYNCDESRTSASFFFVRCTIKAWIRTWVVDGMIDEILPQIGVVVFLTELDRFAWIIAGFHYHRQRLLVVSHPRWNHTQTPGWSFHSTREWIHVHWQVTICHSSKFPKMSQKSLNFWCFLNVEVTSTMLFHMCETNYLTNSIILICEKKEPPFNAAYKKYVNKTEHNKTYIADLAQRRKWYITFHVFRKKTCNVSMF